ncbi:MAG: helix-turn-helix domain-containing protein [Actinomycetota bacterium]|jgi:DNA-directed RNA polymerase specialized sigma24 family protein|nr:helix-turn-helix domain-containing protein [Actinomycetota bacterium]
MGTGRRLTPRQAADQLGVSVEAVRGRIKRGTIAHERDGDRVFVLLEADQTATGHDQGGDQSELVAQLRDEIAFLRDQVRRQQEITAQQAVTMRQLSAPAEPDESTTVDQDEEEPPESTEGAETGTQRPTGVPWWRGWFGG